MRLPTDREDFLLESHDRCLAQGITSDLDRFVWLAKFGDEYSLAHELQKAELGTSMLSPPRLGLALAKTTRGALLLRKTSTITS